MTNREFYAGCSARLEQGGVFCQIVDLSVFSTSQLRNLGKTFNSVFPQGQVWQLSSDSIAFLGSNSPLTYRPAAVLQMWRGHAEVRQDLVALNVLDPVNLHGYRLCPREAIEAQTPNARIFTEDRPQIGWKISDRAAHHEANFAWTQQLRGTGDFHRFAMGYACANLGDLRAAAAVLEGCPESQPKAFLQSQIALLKMEDAQKQIGNALKTYPDDYRIRFLAALEAIRRLDYPAALEHLKVCAAHTDQAPPIDKPAPGDLGYAGSNGWEYPVYQAIGGCYEAQGKWQEASSAYQKAAEYSNLSAPLRALGRTLMRQKNWALAQHSLVRSVQRNPNDYESWNLLGQVRAQMGQLDKAVIAFQEGLRLAPGHREMRLNLAQAHAQQQLPGKAKAEIRRLLQFYPGDAEALALQSKL